MQFRLDYALSREQQNKSGGEQPASQPLHPACSETSHHFCIPHNLGPMPNLGRGHSILQLWTAAACKMLQDEKVCHVSSPLG